jgi:predicted dehydrogenase
VRPPIYPERLGEKNIVLRVGIVGIGFMGLIHYLSYQSVRGVRVAAICSSSPKRRSGDWRGIQGNFGPPGSKVDLSNVKVYSALDEMVRGPDLDLIDVTLPPALHAEASIKAMQAGKDVFCEKPMALDLRECRRMQDVSARTGQRLFIGHTLPFVPEYAWALKVARGGKYGKLLGGSFKRVISDPNWLKQYWSAEHIGGPMLDLHVHDAHFIRLMFGMPNELVTQGRLRNELAEYWNTLFDYGESGPRVHVTSGTIRQQGRAFEHGFEIHLEKATLVFDFAVIGKEGKYLCPLTLIDDRGKVHVVKLGNGDPMQTFQAEIREVVSSSRKQKESDLLNSRLACDAVHLCRRQIESLNKGRAVRV